MAILKAGPDSWTLKFWSFLQVLNSRLQGLSSWSCDPGSIYNEEKLSLHDFDELDIFIAEVRYNQNQIIMQRNNLKRFIHREQWTFNSLEANYTLLEVYNLQRLIFQQGARIWKKGRKVWSYRNRIRCGTKFWCLILKSVKCTHRTVSVEVWLKLQSMLNES